MSIQNIKDHRFYRIWQGIRSRAGNIKFYEHVTLSEDWHIFPNFEHDMYGSYVDHVKIHGEKDTTIERVDIWKGYTKENCVWATMKQQANNRRNGRYITYKGKTRTLSAWAEILGISRQLLWKRLKSGYPLSKALDSHKQQYSHKVNSTIAIPLSRDNNLRKKMDVLYDNVISGRYGTKNRSELLSAINDLRSC